MAKHEFNDGNFEAEVLQSEKPVLVDFFATWCGPCQKMAPIIDELAEEMADKVTIGKLDVEQAQASAGSFQVMSIPTFILFKGGEPVARTEGGQSKEALQSFIESNL